ncbi:MAG TPA: UDP-N-acetylglucosamine 2-epimerase, partial [Gammaproteobacteria bacterium]|nr:UDP-N-acetylglucosamine 2-epimerase [Gammaproteobacteria bacterium]
EQADLVVGNSSSGLYEAPSLHTPTLDIGTRQQGRLRGPSVLHAENEHIAIGRMIESILRDPPQDFSNPYGDGVASRRIADVLLAIDDPRQLLIKHFVEAN